MQLVRVSRPSDNVPFGTFLIELGTVMIVASDVASDVTASPKR